MVQLVAVAGQDATSSVAVRLVAVGAPRGTRRRGGGRGRHAARRGPVARPPRGCGAASRPCAARRRPGCAAFLDELGTARGVDLITPVSAKRHDGIVHRAAREGRAECARVLARRGASRYTCCATGHQASVLAQAAALFSSERAPRRRGRRRERGRQPAALLPVHARFHSTARQRDLLDACELYVENEATEGRLPPKTKIRRAAARLEPYRATLEAPADADAPARARFAKVCFAAIRAARAGRAAVVAALVDEFGCDPTGRGFLVVAAARRRAGAFHSVLPGSCWTGSAATPTRTDARGVCVLRAAGRAEQAGDAGPAMWPRGVAEHGPRRERRDGAPGRGARGLRRWPAS